MSQQVCLICGDLGWVADKRVMDLIVDQMKHGDGRHSEELARLKKASGRAGQTWMMSPCPKGPH